MEYYNQTQDDWRIAQCCQFHDKALVKRYNLGTTTKTYALKEGGKQRVQTKAISNCKKLLDIISTYFPTQPKNLRAFRISSELLPCYTLDFTAPWYDEIRDEIKEILAETGRAARKHSIRLSVHPAQYTVLASNKVEVVKKSIEDLEYHALYGQYMGIPAEEFSMNIHLQGLYGGKGLAKFAKKNKWQIIGIMNNDMIGNIKGIDGVIDNRTFRIFSEPVPPTETQKERQMRRFYGGEVDGVSRQLARYIHKNVKLYMPEMNPLMVYRLDRFGRGGHHRPFNDAGYAGVRIMEAHENYTQQHQDLRVENGIGYGDTFEHVNFAYAKKLTAVNAINLASLASAPPAPKNIKIGGIVEPSVKFRWDHPVDDSVSGYKIYWRETTSSTWDYSRLVNKLNNYTLDGIVIDNFIFGISTVNSKGFESLVTFPQGTFRD